VLIACLIGLGLGFVGSVPIAGPISAIVLQRGLARRYASAAYVGAGAAVGEGIYAFLAFWGFASLLSAHLWVDVLARAIAAVILVVLGIVFLRFRAPTADDAPVARGRDAPGPSLLLGFSVTMINPTLLATWAATATTLYSTGFPMTPRDALPFAVGAALGIGGWFALLAWLLKRYGERFERRLLEKVVKGIGAALLGIAVWFVFRFVQALEAWRNTGT